MTAADARFLDRWFTLLLAGSTTLHASAGITRPLASYRALEIGLDAGYLGIMAAAHALAPLVFAVALGRLVDRYGSIRFIIGGTVAMAATALALAFARDPVSLLVLMAAAGLSHYAVIIAIQATIASRNPISGYDRRFAQLAFVASGGQMLGPLVGGVVLGDGSSANITSAILVSSVMAGGLLPLLAWVGRTDPGPHAPAAEAEAVAPPIRDILRMPGMLPAMLASTTVLSAIDMIVVYLPAFGEERLIPASFIGFILAVRAASSMASRVLLARMVTWFGRGPLLIGSMAVSAVSLALVPLVPDWALVPVLVIGGFGLGIGQPLTISWVAQQASPAARGTALSVRLMGNRVGQVAVPLGASSVAAAAGAAGVLVGMGLTIAASVVVVWARIGSFGSRPAERR